MAKIYRSDFINNPGNCLYPHAIEITDIESLKEAFKCDYVCAEYDNNYRSASNFKSATIVPVDCDNEHTEDESKFVTIEDVKEAFPNVKFYVHYSRNHMKEKNGKKARPKFHILFEIDKTTDSKA